MFNKYQLYCCGSRGSRPVEGRRFNEFGGFTSCYILKTDDYALIIDCGTGFYEANSIVCDCSKVDIVLTHVHYDHILGMLDWTAIPKTSIVNFYANFDGWFGEDTMIEFFRKPFWPVQPDFKIHQCPIDGVPLELQEDLSIEFYDAPHPNGAKLLLIRHKEFNPDSIKKGKIENPEDYEERRLAVMFDCEKSTGLNEDLIRDCDLLIYDGMYTDEEYPTKVGYGHSTWEEGCRLANKIQCGRLIITHHDPNRNDDELREFERQARTMYPNTDFARSGQIWDLSSPEKIKRRVVDIFADRIENDANEGKTFAGNISKKAKKFKRYTHLLTTILTEETTMRKFMFKFTNLLLGIVSGFMSFVNYFTGYNYLMISTIVFCALCLINFFLVDIKKISLFIKYLFAFEFIALFSFFVVAGTPEGFSIIWTLMLPTLGMLVFGKRECMIASLLMLLIIIFFFWTPVGNDILNDAAQVFQKPDEHTGLVLQPYSSSMMLRFPFAFLAFLLLGYLTETIRAFGFRKLNELKTSLRDRLADQTSELRDQNFELTRVNSQLGLRNRLLNNTFGRFMDDKVVDKLLENPNMTVFEGEIQNVTILQCDIRGFSKKVNEMNPIDVVGMINYYFTEMTDIIQKNNGTILDFVGDAILVVFGAPLTSVCQGDDAIHAALQMQREMIRINEWNKANFYPELEIGIGIHSGEAILGTLGSQKHLKYDAIGRTVSNAAEIEAKASGGEILVSEETMKLVKDSYEVEEEFDMDSKGKDRILHIKKIKYQFDTEK